MASTSNKLEFNLVRPESWAGINNQNKDLVFFLTDKDNPDARARGFLGDQGLGKTSILTCMRYLMGGDEPDNSVNTDTGLRKAEMVVTNKEEGVKYIAKCTNKSFTVTRVVGEEGAALTTDVKQPREFLRKMIGPVGVSPMVLKEKKPAEQIEWVRSMYHFTDAQLKEEKEMLTGQKTTYKARTGLNTRIKEQRTELVRSGYFNWNKEKQVLRPRSEFAVDSEKFSKDMKERKEELEVSFKDISERHATYAAHQQKLSGDDGYPARISRNEKKIEDLQRQIKELQIENESIQANYEISQKFVGDNVNVEKELEDIQLEMSAVGQYLFDKDKFDKVKERQSTYNDLLGERETVEAKLEDYERQYKEFVASFTPDIEGIEVAVPVEVDLPAEKEVFLSENPDATKDEIAAHEAGLRLKMREGLYYNGHSTTELCESELWDLSIQLWQKMGVKVILVENINTLGSAAVERINQFIEDGGNLFYSEMHREIKDMKLQFNTQLK